MAGQRSNPFDSVPIETNQHIASYLTSDFDLCNFRLVSHATHDAVDADNDSFWRRRFLAVFETPVWGGGRGRSTATSNLKFKREYQKRRRCLMFGAKYEAALTRREGKEIRKGTEALEVIRELLVDAFSEKPDSSDHGTVYESVNLAAVLNFISNHDLLHFVLLPERKPPPPLRQRTRSSKSSMDIVCLPQQLLQTIQILLAPAMFDLERNLNHFSFSTSQQVVYGTSVEHPIFEGCHGLDVNPAWVLHHINFWKFHMTRPAECTLHGPFRDLSEDGKPRFWSRQLRQGSDTLGTRWKGSYAYLDRDLIADVRTGRGNDSPIADEFNGEADGGAGCFQDLKLDLVDEGDTFWPATFETHLRSLAPPPSRAKTRAQQRSATPEGLSAFKHQSFQFTGEGHDVAEDFCAQGWLNALPAQQGVPGWQRMTMMKYYEDLQTGGVDHDSLWAYEGVVLPGGQIMLGRWWSPGDGVGSEQYSGPFILWCVDGPEVVEEGEVSNEDEDVDEDNLP
ncbi:hypothetical protein B0A55_05109 [Friedmanniomyces simplex]|uniref:F-box domain-containing protein n=1 Tax=Friedmanniomyces simplex TaxID=329884 RepID=A0A4U0XIQ4_9PEZI|nr:hypothetical protein B0A55_05109 [Friedmanniomyces simplex]